MMLIKKCSVALSRIPADELAQYMNNVVLINVPIRRLTKRNKRVMSCIEPFTFEERDALQKNDSNPVMQPSSNQHQIVHECIETSSVRLNSTANKHSLVSQPNPYEPVAANGNDGHFLVAQPVQSTEHSVVLVDVPFRRLTKRNKRVMSCIDSYTFEERDEFQLKDSNPVMQPSSNQHPIVHELINTSGSSVRLNSTVNEHCPIPQKKLSDAVATCSKSTVNGYNEGKSTVAKNECMQCFTYKQNIFQLKKQIKEMQKDTLVHMSQYDNLQDRCTQLIQKNKTLQQEIGFYRGM